MKAMGIDERSLAGNKNPIADHVSTMGQDKMRLLPGVPVAPTGIAAGVVGKWSKFEGTKYVFDRLENFIKPRLTGMG